MKQRYLLNDLLINYSLLYIFILFFSNILTLKIPGISIIREFYVLLVIFSVYIVFCFDKFLIKKNKFDYTVIIFVVANVISLIISPNKEYSISSFIIITSGPLIAYCLSKLEFTLIQYTFFHSVIIKFFIFSVISALAIYPIQFNLYKIIGIGKDFKDLILFYRFTSSGKMWMRLSGLCAHPNILGLVVFALIVMCLLNKKRKSAGLLLVPYYLTNVRTYLIGLPLCWYSYLPKRKKIILFFLGFLGIFVLIYAFLSVSLDSSLTRHFDDILAVGPKLLKESISLFGYGHGTMSPYCPSDDALFIHIESDFFALIMQLGVLGLGIYLILLFQTISELRKYPNKYSKYIVYLIYIFYFGCIVFPLHPARFLSNYIWIEVGLYLSVIRNRQNLNALQI